MPSGHVDFYANGGFDQPGCHQQTAMSPGSCNHDRAPEYYAESIYTEKGFWGFRCGELKGGVLNYVTIPLFQFTGIFTLSASAKRKKMIQSPKWATVSVKSKLINEYQ